MAGRLTLQSQLPVGCLRRSAVALPSGDSLLGTRRGLQCSCQSQCTPLQTHTDRYHSLHTVHSADKGGGGGHSLGGKHRTGLLEQRRGILRFLEGVHCKFCVNVCVCVCVHVCACECVCVCAVCNGWESWDHWCAIPSPHKCYGDVHSVLPHNPRNLLDCLATLVTNSMEVEGSASSSPSMSSVDSPVAPGFDDKESATVLDAVPLAASGSTCMSRTEATREMMRSIVPPAGAPGEKLLL